MPGRPYWYFVPYQQDLQAALDALRAREFAAGRYSPVLQRIDFHALFAHAPGAQHPSIAAAKAAADVDGTRSILDIEKVGAHARYGMAAPYPSTLLVKWYGTATPSRAQVAKLEVVNDLGRGQCNYVVLHEGGQPREILFFGLSFDD